MGQWVKLASVDIVMLRFKSSLCIISVENLVPSTAMSSAAIMLPRWNKRVFVFHKERFEHQASFQCHMIMMIENAVYS